MRKLKLQRDKIISIVKGRQLVGLYVEYEHRDFDDNYQKNLLIGEISLSKADKIIKLWNQK